MSSGVIRLQGLFEHNLQGIDVDIPKQAITVITGVSGSGKSSLAYDSLALESQRRFFDSLSHYSRLFLEQSGRPKVRKASGLQPAVLLKQNERYPTKRASVASSSSLGELLALAFARFGETFCPIHNLKTAAQPIDRWVDTLAQKFSGEVIAVTAPILTEKKGNPQKLLQALASRGFSRVLINEELHDLSELPILEKDKAYSIKLVVDFVRVAEANIGRLIRSLDKAKQEGEGYCECFLALNSQKLDIASRQSFSAKHGCPVCAFNWIKLDKRYFAANSLGSCKLCKGFGCKSCGETGLDAQYRSVRIFGLSMHDYLTMELKQLAATFSDLLSKSQDEAFHIVFSEALRVTDALCQSGLSHLALNRRLRSLSSGEGQRVRIANLLSEKLRGVVYVCDEPSFGLHPSEIRLMLESLRAIVDYGNTVVLVDHDERVIAEADHLIELGPGGGKSGGQVIYTGSDAKQVKSLNPEALGISSSPSTQLKRFFSIFDANTHNLAIERVDFLWNGFNVVSGVSGAGKSSLIWDELYPLLKRQIADPDDALVKSKLQGTEMITRVEKVDRRPIARSGAQTVASYLKVFASIRSLFAKTSNAQILGLTSRSFSLQSAGGRCDACKGRGEVYLSMKFLADAVIPCSVCRGHRFKDNVLKVRYLSLNISEVLSLDVAEAQEIFARHPDIYGPLKAASDLGLSYLQLGQPLHTLSGGEAQRLKLTHLLRTTETTERLLLLDEPSQGLSRYDMHAVLRSLRAIVNLGNTVIVIEHDTQFIKESDWIIDLGPKAASEGGRLVYNGDLRGFYSCQESQTARFL